MGCLTIKTKRLDPLRFTCSLVCDVGRGGAKYLRVKPEEVQWVYPQVETYYDVESNTKWNVV